MRFLDQYGSKGITYAKGNVDLRVISALDVHTDNNAAHREAPAIHTDRLDQNKAYGEIKNTYHGTFVKAIGFK